MSDLFYWVTIYIFLLFIFYFTLFFFSFLLFPFFYLPSLVPYFLTFSFPEPPFLLVTWSAKRRALVGTLWQQLPDVRKSRTSGNACVFFARISAQAQKLILREGGHRVYVSVLTNRKSPYSVA